MLCLARQVPHHQVKQWLHHGRNEHMSANAYRAHALAELANSATFNYRCDADACAHQHAEQMSLRPWGSQLC